MRLSTLETDRSIAAALPRAWPAFFQRFGRLTPVQREVIPGVLEGADLLVCSATASGKTEAVCAPLVEKHFDRRDPWTILYISPTRALINDLKERLDPPLCSLGLRIARRTGEYKDPLAPPPPFLITTPESLDSLLCRGATEGGHPLGFVDAVVLDEIHLLHGTGRGEQLRWLLERLRRLRLHAVQKQWVRTQEIQIVALSATVPDPSEVISTYLPEGRLVEVPGSRGIETVGPPSLDAIVQKALSAHLCSFPEDEKVLVFCNSRRRVDDLTVEMRDPLSRLGYGVLGHHGSLSKIERETAESQLKQEGKVVVVATSTLEIGIDVGGIDLVVLDGPPPDIPALLQRIGRGNRRTDTTRLMPCSGSLTDAIVQAAMIDAARDGWLGFLEHGPQFAVTRQQIASYIFQSPRRARSRARIADFLSSSPDPDSSFAVLEKMIFDSELLEDGEGLRLGDYWIDLTAEGTIHSNIEGSGGDTVIDEKTGQEIAKGVDFRGGKGLHVGGHLLQVKKWSEWKIEVRPVKSRALAEGDWRYASRPWMKGAGQPQAVRRYLQIPPDMWPLIHLEGRTLVFHFGGGRRKAVLQLIGSRDVASVNDWLIQLPGTITSKPDSLTGTGPGVLRLRIGEEVDRLERTLGRPFANKSLPLDVRIREVEGWLALEDEVDSLQAAKWSSLQDNEATGVLELIGRALTRT